jgi:integrase
MQAQKRPSGPRTPGYRLHKPSGQAVVTLSGRDHYLGPHGTGASRASYDRLVALWLANGRRRLGKDRQQLTIDELLEPFEEWARSYYNSSGRSDEFSNQLRYAMRALSELFGSTRAASFDALTLKAIRQRMLDEGRLARTTINARISRIRRIFEWGVQEGLVPTEVVVGLRTVKGLRRGRSKAPEPEAVRPVSQVHVDAVLHHLNGDVRAMVELMWLTGMRVGEVCAMRADRIDRDPPGLDGVWLYEPKLHKTAHHGHRRCVLFGAKAQGALTPFLCRPADRPLFSPLLAALAVEKAGGRRVGSRPLRDAYTDGGVRRAIARACKLAGVPHWHPHQLRHAAATRIRSAAGLDVARAVLGHRTYLMTDEYAEADLRVAAGFVNSLTS